MATYLLAANPIHGHAGPILQVARGLVARGDAVTVLTGSRFAAAVADAGAAFLPLQGGADYDDRDVASYLPDHAKYRGVARTEYDIRTIFVETIPAQYASLVDAIARTSPAAVLVDGAFAGALPLGAQTVDRPPILGLGVTPLTQSSPDVAPHGLALPPARHALDRARYAILGAAARNVIFSRTQRRGREVFAECGAELKGFILDASRLFDRFLQTGPASLEYPRAALSANTTFVGVLPSGSGGAVDVVEDGTPLVHVTQGTIDNHDFGRLVRPTIDAIAGSDVHVVVSTGGRDPEEVGPVPANVRLERYLSYDALLPRTAVMVTNGGYGGVQAALAAGVPLVVAGGTEDKPEVAARVAWSGAGVDLRTGTPQARAIARAVDAVLTDPSYRGAAERIATDIASHDALAEIAGELATARVPI